MSKRSGGSLKLVAAKAPEPATPQRQDSTADEIDEIGQEGGSIAGRNAHTGISPTAKILVLTASSTLAPSLYLNLSTPLKASDCGDQRKNQMVRDHLPEGKPQEAASSSWVPCVVLGQRASQGRCGAGAGGWLLSRMKATGFKINALCRPMRTPLGAFSCGRIP
jgi:hypothetical protein